MISSYFKPTPKRILKVLLALRGLIITLSTAAYFNQNKDAAFWIMVAGAVVDFFMQCMEPGTTAKTRKVSVIIWVIIISVLFL